jgi:hypothetical protein
MTSSWGDEVPTGAKMSDTMEAAPKEPPIAEQVSPQVRLAPSENVHVLVIPDLGGLAIGHQWHEVTAEQLEQIQTAARNSKVQLEVKEGS